MAGYPDSTPRVSAVTVVNNILLNLNRQTGLQDEFDSAQDRLRLGWVLQGTFLFLIFGLWAMASLIMCDDLHMYVK